MLSAVLLIGYNVHAAPSLSSSYGVPSVPPLGLSLPQQSFEIKNERQETFSLPLTTQEHVSANGDTATFTEGQQSLNIPFDSQEHLSVDGDTSAFAKDSLSFSTSEKSGSIINLDDAVTNVRLFQQGITSLSQIKDNEFQRANIGVVRCDTEPIVDTVTITNVMNMPSTTYQVRTLSQSVTSQQILTKVVHATQTVTYMTRVLATKTALTTKPVTATVTRQLPDQTVVNTVTQVETRTEAVRKTSALLHTHVLTEVNYQTVTSRHSSVVYIPQTHTANVFVTATPQAVPITQILTKTNVVTASDFPFIRMHTYTATVIESSQAYRTVAADTATVLRTAYHTQTQYRTSTAYQTQVSTVILDETVTQRNTNIRTITETSIQRHVSAAYVPRAVKQTEYSTAWKKATETITLTHTAIQPVTKLAVFLRNGDQRIEITDRPIRVETTTLTAFKSNAQPRVDYVTRTLPCKTNTHGYQGYNSINDPHQKSYN